MPASSAISTRSRAVSGANSAGLCTTVQPAASAGAIFHVESMKGVFQGVMMPTGPIGTRVVMLIWPSPAQHLAVARRRCAVGKEAKILRAAQSRLGHEFQGLPGIHAFDERDLLGPGDDCVRDFMQELLALLAGEPGPFGERCLRRLGSAVNVSRLAVGNLCQRLQIHWR